MKKSSIAIYFVLLFMMGCSIDRENFSYLDKKDVNKDVDPTTHSRNYNLSEPINTKENNNNSIVLLGGKKSDQNNDLSYLTKKESQSELIKAQNNDNPTIYILIILTSLVIFLCALSSPHIIYEYVKRKIKSE